MSEVNTPTETTKEATTTPKAPPTKEDIRKALETLAVLARKARRKHRGQNPGAFGGRLKSLRPKKNDDNPIQ